MRPKFVLIGDSITEEAFNGWAADLAHHFSRSADMVLRGYSGYNTRWALKVMDETLGGVAAADAPPLTVTVFFGSNDATIADRSSGFQHLPVEEHRNNLQTISPHQSLEISPIISI